MLDKIAHYFDFQQRALNLQAYRAEVIGSNVANAETPYYKAVDFDFKSALQAQVDKQGQLGLALTDARHIANQTGGAAACSCNTAARCSPAWTATRSTWISSAALSPTTLCSISPRWRF